MRTIFAIILVFTFFVPPLTAQELAGTLNKLKKQAKYELGTGTPNHPCLFQEKMESQPVTQLISEYKL